MTLAEPRLARMRERLVEAARPDGGWPYYSGHASRLEPTCWALLALAELDPKPGLESSAHREFFERSQRHDGLLLEPALGEEDRPNVGFNGLAALVLATHKEFLAGEGDRERLVAAILAHKGLKLAQSSVSPQDNSLQAWAWIDATFSWVEPTCCCMLALKKHGSASAQAKLQARIDEAERLLRDRSCPSGGWNAGNGAVFGQGLFPYVPTTALGLLALQNLRADPVVARSLQLLTARSTQERSAMALSLAVIALAVYGVDTGVVRAALLEQWDRTEYLGNLHLTALALYGLTGEQHGFAAFRI